MPGGGGVPAMLDCIFLDKKRTHDDRAGEKMSISFKITSAGEKQVTSVPAQSAELW